MALREGESLPRRPPGARWTRVNRRRCRSRAEPRATRCLRPIEGRLSARPARAPMAGHGTLTCPSRSRPKARKLKGWSRCGRHPTSRCCSRRTRAAAGARPAAKTKERESWSSTRGQPQSAGAAAAVPGTRAAPLRPRPTPGSAPALSRTLSPATCRDSWITLLSGGKSNESAIVHRRIRAGIVSLYKDSATELSRMRAQPCPPNRALRPAGPARRPLIRSAF